MSPRLTAGAVAHSNQRFQAAACAEMEDPVYSSRKGVSGMVTKEEILAEIEKVPEQYWEELYRVIKDFETGKEERDGAEESVMAKLRKIRISAPPDFSTKVDLYDPEG